MVKIPLYNMEHPDDDTANLLLFATFLFGQIQECFMKFLTLCIRLMQAGVPADSVDDCFKFFAGFVEK